LSTLLASFSPVTPRRT